MSFIKGIVNLSRKGAYDKFELELNNIYEDIKHSAMKGEFATTYQLKYKYRDEEEAYKVYKRKLENEGFEVELETNFICAGVIDINMYISWDMYDMDSEKEEVCELEINGVISGENISREEIFDKFIDWCEENNFYFGGGCL